MFTPQQLGTMLEMQNSLQCAQLGKDWVRTTAHNYGRAIAVEAAEAMDHVGYKWWKDKEIDKEQLIMEGVDMLHFELCWGLQRGATHHNFGATVEAAKELCENFARLPNFPFEKDLILVILDETLVQGVRNNGVMYSLLKLFKACNLTGDDVFKLYIGKNVLNSFRRANGYKDGTYTKLWAGEEDNEVLTRVLVATSVDVLDFESVVYQKLNAIYTDLGLKL